MDALFAFALCHGSPTLHLNTSTQSGPFQNHRRRRCRTVTYAQIGADGNPMSEREAEIAAKIAKLRSLNKLKSQTGRGSVPDPDSLAGDAGDGVAPKETGAAGEGSSGRATMPAGFSDLPDWKKEEVLLGEMQKAEAFLASPQSPSPTAEEAAPLAPSPESETNDDGSEGGRREREGAHSSENVNTKKSAYKPKVGTWGVFPRPDNISKAYGGGRAVPIGGRKTDADPEAKKREAEIKERLAAYRKSRGIDMEREERHEREINAAMEAADRCMRGAFAYEAVRELEAVKSYVSPMSQRGGEVYLALALGYEATGQREEARKVYGQLQQSAFPTVSRQARHLLAGFDAEETMRVDGTSASEGGKLKVGNFNLPDVAGYTEKRYETVILPKAKADPTSAADTVDDDDTSGRDVTLILIALLCVAILPIVVLRAASH